MKPQVLPITAKDLRRLKPLLDQSAGYDVSLEEEETYFDPDTVRNWRQLVFQEECLGFIRAFPQANWGSVELFARQTDSFEREWIQRTLLKEFLEASAYASGFRLRLELNAVTSTFAPMAMELGFRDRVENFLLYEIAPTLACSEQPAKKVRFAVPAETAQVTEVFQNLHPVTQKEVQLWILKQEVFVAAERSCTIHCAAHIQISDTTSELEIVRIASHVDSLRQGHAKVLLTGLHQHFAQTKARIFLKVDALKVPARRLYEKLGYRRKLEADQIWLSKIF